MHVLVALNLMNTTMKCRNLSQPSDLVFPIYRDCRGNKIKKNAWIHEFPPIHVYLFKGCIQLKIGSNIKHKCIKNLFALYTYTTSFLLFRHFLGLQLFLLRIPSLRLLLLVISLY